MFEAKIIKHRALKHAKAPDSAKKTPDSAKTRFGIFATLCAVKKIYFFAFFALGLAAVDFSANAGALGVYNSQTKQGSLAFLAAARADLRGDVFDASIEGEALKDLRYKKRQYGIIKEAALFVNAPRARIFGGRRIFFFGSLESYNPSDVLNQQNRKRDVFAKEKLGADVAGVDLDLGAFELLALVKFHEERNEYLAVGPFPAPPIRAVYFAKSQNAPQYLVRAQKSFDSAYPLDLTLLYVRGFDSAEIFTRAGALRFFSDKFASYGTQLVGNTLLKFELVQTLPHRDKAYPPLQDLSSFWQAGAGFEYSSDFWGGTSLGVLAEYHRAGETKRRKIRARDLVRLHNDAFAGLRLKFNDLYDSSALAGVFKPLSGGAGASGFFKLNSRVFDALSLDLGVFFLQNKQTASKLGLAYYF